MKTLFYALILSWILPISLGNASEQDRTAFFLPEIDAFSQWDKENSFPKRAVLFVGSSSINYWPSAEAFPEVPIINRGFGGSISTDILYFYDRVIAKYRPRTVVIYVGDNDIALGLTAEKTSDTLKILIQKIAHDFPKTRIIYLPIKPSLLRWDMWPDMKISLIMPKRASMFFILIVQHHCLEPMGCLTKSILLTMDYTSMRQVIEFGINYWNPI